MSMSIDVGWWHILYQSLATGFFPPKGHCWNLPIDNLKSQCVSCLLLISCYNIYIYISPYINMIFWCSDVLKIVLARCLPISAVTVSEAGAGRGEAWTLQTHHAPRGDALSSLAERVRRRWGVTATALTRWVKKTAARWMIKTSVNCC